jgi:hypothetical protein
MQAIHRVLFEVPSLFFAAGREKITIDFNRFQLVHLTPLPKLNSDTVLKYKPEALKLYSPASQHNL